MSFLISFQKLLKTDKTGVVGVSCNLNGLDIINQLPPRLELGILTPGSLLFLVLIIMYGRGSLRPGMSLF